MVVRANQFLLKVIKFVERCLYKTDYNISFVMFDVHILIWVRVHKYAVSITQVYMCGW